MNKLSNDAIGVDVSNYDLESSTLNEVLECLYGEHPAFTSIADSLNAQFGLVYHDRMLRHHSRAGTMCRPLYDHITSLVDKDVRHICTVLYQFMKINGAETADLTTCLRLLLEFAYVQMQVVKKHVDKLLLRTQQLLHLKSTDQVKEFIDAYNRFPVQEAVQGAFMQTAGNYLSRVASSGLPSGHWI